MIVIIMISLVALCILMCMDQISDHRWIKIMREVRSKKSICKKSIFLNWKLLITCLIHLSIWSNGHQLPTYLEHIDTTATHQMLASYSILVHAFSTDTVLWNRLFSPCFDFCWRFTVREERFSLLVCSVFCHKLFWNLLELIESVFIRFTCQL